MIPSASARRPWTAFAPTALALAVALGALATAPLPAAVLAAFTCVRPKPWPEGSLRNVSVAASLIDGIALAPGEVFSFNDAMRAGDGRFVRGTSFLDGREVSSVGGGICQVSSGLYNAALLAGLEVLERANHSLYDPSEAYVAPGRDAMVTRSGHSDFRFRNSTAAPLTIVARAEGGALTVELLGFQKTRRQRWIVTRVLAHRRAGVRERLDPSLAPGACRLLRPGFDGWVVACSLCSGADGTTRCASLGTDRYRRVDALWAVGPDPGLPAVAAPTAHSARMAAVPQAGARP